MDMFFKCRNLASGIKRDKDDGRDQRNESKDLIDGQQKRVVKTPKTGTQ